MATIHSEAARLLGARVRARRNKLALNQEEAAALADMHWTNWGKIERGTVNPSLSTLIRIAGVLELDVAELVCGLSLDDLPPRPHRLTATEFINERLSRES